MRRDHEPVEMPGDFDRQLGRRIQAAREAIGLSRDELADLVDTDATEIEAWENGATVIYVEELVKLCQALKRTLDHLTGMNEQ